MWDDEEFSRRMERIEQSHRLDDENYRRKEQERERETQRKQDDEIRERYEKVQRNQDDYYRKQEEIASKRIPDGYDHFTITVPSSPRSFGIIIARIIDSIIGAVIFGAVVGYFLGRLGLIGGAIFGWTIGGLIGRKLLIVLGILAVLGCGLYYGRSYVTPLSSFVTDKVLPLSESTVTVTDDVNLRAEPSTDGAIIKTLKRGETVTSTGKVSGGWTQVSHSGDTGWVSSEYLKNKDIKKNRLKGLFGNVFFKQYSVISQYMFN